jgi:hypothetical protein
MKTNYLEEKLLRLGYPRTIARESRKDLRWLREEKITDKLMEQNRRKQ